FKRAMAAGLAVGAAVSLLLFAAPAQAATVASPHDPSIKIALFGSDTTQDVMEGIVQNPAAGDWNIKAGRNQNPNRTAPADTNCNAATYGPAATTGVFAAPFGSGAGQHALRDSVATPASFPENGPATNSGVLHGCADVARSSARPNATDDGAVGTAEYYAF